MTVRVSATIADVAKAAKVSSATVSFVLNNTKVVTPEVHARVLAAVEALRYQPSHAAKALRTGKTATLGLLIPDLTNPFFPKLAQDVELAASRAGYAILFSDSHDNLLTQQTALHHLESRGVDLILVVPAVGTNENLKSYLPLVVIDRIAGTTPSVRSNKFLGGQQAAEHLLALGHNSFAILAGPKVNQQPGQRVQGMLTAIKEAGLKVSSQNLFYSDYNVESGFNGMTQLLEKAKPFTGLLAASDTLALGALSALQNAGLSVPNDFSLVGFDDIPWAALSYPPLTTVRQDTAALANQAVEVALYLQKHGNNSQVHPELVSTQLIVRSSSATPTKTLGSTRKAQHDSGRRQRQS